MAVTLPPHSLETEQAVLGCMLSNENACFNVREILKADDFFDDRHRALYQIIEKIHNSGASPDIVTVTTELQRTEQTHSVGGSAYLSRLLEGSFGASQSVRYAETVKDYAVQRNIRQAAQEIVEFCKGADGAGSVASFAEEKIFTAIDRTAKIKLWSAQEASVSALRRIEAAYQAGSGLIGVSTGYKGVDKQLHGLQNKSLNIIAARPSMGKTAFAMGIAKHAAGKTDVLVFSLEMDTDELYMRMLSDEAEVDLMRLRSGWLKDGEAEKLSAASEKLSKLRMTVIDRHMSIGEIRSICRREHMRGRLGMVVIDHLQLVHVEGKHHSRLDEMTGITKTLKGMAKDLDIPVIALSQLNRGVESRQDAVPRMSDLRESGSIEQDADVVMMLYREEYYLKDKSTRPGRADIMIEKNRNGPVGTVEMEFQKRYVRFVDLQTLGEMQGKDKAEVDW